MATRIPSKPTSLKTPDKVVKVEKEKETTVAIKLSKEEEATLSKWIDKQKGLVNRRAPAIKFLYQSAIDAGCMLVAQFGSDDDSETSIPVQMDIEG